MTRDHDSADPSGAPEAPCASDRSFDSSAADADAVARAATESADAHDRMARHVPGASEHADQDRDLAAAQNAAAGAYRAHREPPDRARHVIENSHRAPVDDGSVDQREIDAELRDTRATVRAAEIDERRRHIDRRQDDRTAAQDRRDDRADARDDRAAVRDDKADERDRHADERDRRAAVRDADADRRDAHARTRDDEADERDRAADQREIDDQSDVLPAEAPHLPPTR